MTPSITNTLSSSLNPSLTKIKFTSHHDNEKGVRMITYTEYNHLIYTNPFIYVRDPIFIYHIPEIKIKNSQPSRANGHINTNFITECTYVLHILSSLSSFSKMLSRYIGYRSNMKIRATGV